MDKKEVLKKIPAIDKILNWPEVRVYSARIANSYLSQFVRLKVTEFRKKIVAGAKVNISSLKSEILEGLNELVRPYFCRSINGLGIILHTGLGRAPFSRGIGDTLYNVSLGYSRLQIDDDGRRADRYKKINLLLQILTGAEAGVIVNNNAAATLLVLNEMAKGREVIVSRGQLIEIGGSFRIPEIMAQSGAIMREIGTTNRTHLRDYESAINDNTAAILRVHQSNYQIKGFTKEVPLNQLVQLGKRYNLPVIDDLGSGALIDLSKYNLPKEPLVQESIKTGADLVCFSGDKLIGGPQCGIIVGKEKYINAIKRNPLTRALRCDKLTNVVLESTLQLFLRSEEIIVKEHGVFRIILKPLNKIKRQANRCARLLKKNRDKSLEVTVRQDFSETGGGSLSTEQLPTYVLAVKTRELSASQLARKLRRYKIPIFGRISEDEYLLDFRTIFEGEEKTIVKAFEEILGNG